MAIPDISAIRERLLYGRPWQILLLAMPLKKDSPSGCSFMMI
jgi:hypothetical protein